MPATLADTGCRRRPGDHHPSTAEALDASIVARNVGAEPERWRLPGTLLQPASGDRTQAGCIFRNHGGRGGQLRQRLPTGIISRSGTGLTSGAGGVALGSNFFDDNWNTGMADKAVTVKVIDRQRATASILSPIAEIRASRCTRRRPSIRGIEHQYNSAILRQGVGKTDTGMVTLSRARAPGARAPDVFVRRGIGSRPESGLGHRRD